VVNIEENVTYFLTEMGDLDEYQNKDLQYNSALTDTATKFSFLSLNPTTIPQDPRNVVVENEPPKEDHKIKKICEEMKKIEIKDEN